MQKCFTTNGDGFNDYICPYAGIINEILLFLIINRFGSVSLLNASAKLQTGCANGGGKSPAFVYGTLNVPDGNLVINGAMVLASGSSFNQQGGQIVLDANNGTPAGSMVFAPAFGVSANPPAVFSLGGWQANTDSTYRPYVSGTFNVTGGSITITDPPYATDGFTFFWQNSAAVSPVFGAQHNLRINTGTGTNISASAAVHYGFYLQTLGGTGQLQLGKLEVNGGYLPPSTRELFFTGNQPYILPVKQVLATYDAKLKVGQGIQLQIKQN